LQTGSDDVPAGGWPSVHADQLEIRTWAEDLSDQTLDHSTFPLVMGLVALGPKYLILTSWARCWTEGVGALKTSTNKDARHISPCESRRFK